MRKRIIFLENLMVTVIMTEFFCGCYQKVYNHAIQEYDADHAPLAVVSTKTNLSNENEKENMEKKKIAITFDDGPHSVYTPLLLDGLNERNVKATFFLIGENCEDYPDIVKRIMEEGHLIGNHTYSHIQLTASNQESFIAEIQKTNEIIEDITKQQASFVRPPYGVWKKELEESLQMFPILWTIDPLDWCTKDAENVAYRVINKAEENAVILLHDCYQTSVEAAFIIIDALQAEGYEFVTVDEIYFQ